MKLADGIVRDAKRDYTNLRQTVREAQPECLATIWGILGLVTDFFPSLLSSTEVFHRLSAFTLYYNDTVHLARRAWVETACFHYGVGHTLLRNMLESLIRGAFWEGMAHKQFRENARIIQRVSTKIGTEKKTLLDWFRDVFKNRPSAEDDMESMSAAVFDTTAALHSERNLSKVVPSLKKMLEQLAAWGLLAPMQDPVAAVSDFLYWELSKDAHLIPNKTLIGRRFVAGKEAFRPALFDEEELDSFCSAFRCVVDAAVVVSMNLVRAIAPPDDSFSAALSKFHSTVCALLPDLYAGKLFAQLKESLTA